MGGVMNDNNIPLYVGIPLVVFLVAAAAVFITFAVAVWMDVRDRHRD
jgi:hypothetical protein